MSPIEPLAMVVISVATSGPLKLATTRMRVTLLAPFVALTGATTRFTNTIRAPGGTVIVVALVIAASALSRMPTIDWPPASGLSRNTCAVQPAELLLRKSAGIAIVSVQLPMLVRMCV